MSWFPKFFGKKSTQPRDSQAPLKSLMSSAPKAGGQMGENARMKRELLGSFKKGGIVKKTGAYKLHKGEEVIPAKKREMAGKMKSKIADKDLNERGGFNYKRSKEEVFKRYLNK
jgi:hypothetical protein